MPAILPSDVGNKIHTVFNDTSPSIPTGSVAHVPRIELTNQLESAIIRPGSTPWLVGYSGVGKTSLRTEVTDRLRDLDTVYTPFRRIEIVQGFEIERDGLENVIRRQVAPYITSQISQSHPPGGFSSSAKLLDQAKVALVIENMESIIGKVSFEDVLFFCKHLSDNVQHSGHVKVLLTIASSPEFLAGFPRLVSGTFDFIHVEAWDDASLSNIIRVGSEKCGLEFSEPVETEIVRLSCGIPRTLHYLAREAAIAAVIAGGHRRKQVLTQDLQRLLRRDTIAGLIRHIYPTYSQQISQLTTTQKAILCLAGRLNGPITLQEVNERLGGLWDQSQLREALASFLIPPLDQLMVSIDETGTEFICRDLRLSTVALMQIRLEAITYPDILDAYRTVLSVSRSDQVPEEPLSTTEGTGKKTFHPKLRSIVALLDSSKVIRGTGFLVHYEGHSLIVTCAHTLTRMQLSRGMSVRVKPTQVNTSLEASICWINASSNSEQMWTADEDVAILCPASPNNDLEGCEFQQLSADVDYKQADYTCFAYPSSFDKKGTWTTEIMIGDYVDGNFLELFQKDARRLGPGASGAPVWGNRDEVVGMIQSRLNDTVYLIPNVSILRALDSYTSQNLGLQNE